MTTPQLDNVIRLSDGRRLAYAVYGDPQGTPVFLFHGTPGSRFWHHPNQSIALELGARILVPDRPGFGLSDFKPDRTILGWSDDVRELADALGFNRFYIAGVSGGCIYALACAYALPERVIAAGLASAPAPFNLALEGDKASGLRRMMAAWAERAPGILRAISKWQTGLLKNAELNLKLSLPVLPPADRLVLADASQRAVFLNSYAHAYDQGTEGHVYEALLILKDWGFPPSQIRVPVELWQGTKDPNVSLQQAKWLEATIPNCKATYVPDAGHLLFFSHWRQILTALLRYH